MFQGNTKAAQMRRQRFGRLYVRRMLHTVSIDCHAVKFPVERRLFEITRQ